MALKDKITLSRDRMISEINGSGMGDSEKTELTNILVDAADGTNGLSKEDKLQNVSETVFSLAMLDARGAIDRYEAAKRDGEIKSGLDKLGEKVDSVVSKMSAVSESLARNDEATEALKRDFEEVKSIKRTKLEVFLDGLRNLKWYWALTAVAITGMIVYKPNVLEFLKGLF